MKKRLLAVLLTVVMLLGLLPTTAFAAENISIYDHTLQEVKAASYPRLQYTGAPVTRQPMARVTVKVGETQSVISCPLNGYQCSSCGYIFGGGYFAPTKYCEVQSSCSPNTNVVDNITFGKGTTYDSRVGYTECLQMNFSKARDYHNYNDLLL